MQLFYFILNCFKAHLVKFFFKKSETQHRFL